MVGLTARLQEKVATSALDDQLKSIYEQGQDPSCRQGIHLSDLKRPLYYKGKASFCYRQLVLSAFFESHPVKHHHPQIAYFERGIDLHRRWQEKFIRAGVSISIEEVHELSPQFGETPQKQWKLLFTPDIIIDIGAGPEIVELKGYNNKAFQALMNSPQELPRDAQIQVNLYCHFTGIPKYIVLVENKNTQQFHAWRGSYDPALVQPYEERLATLDKLVQVYMSTNRLPKRICSEASDTRAQECGMCQVCFASQQERQQWIK